MTKFLLPADCLTRFICIWLFDFLNTASSDDVLFNFLYASRKTKQNKFFKSDNWGRNYYMYYANIEEPRCDGVDRWNVTKLTRNRHVDELIMFTHFRKHGIFWWGKKINFYHLFKWIRLEYKNFLSETQTANWELGQTVIDRSCLQGNVESISRVKFVPQFRKLAESYWDRKFSHRTK